MYKKLTWSRHGEYMADRFRSKMVEYYPFINGCKKTILKATDHQNTLLTDAFNYNPDAPTKCQRRELALQAAD